MKKILSVLAICMLIAALSLSALAAEGKTVYVADGGTGDGATADAPLGNLATALAALDGKGGTIVLVGNVTRGGTTIPEQSGNLTITSVNGAKLLVSGRTTIAKNTNDNTFIFDMPLEVTANAAVSFEGRFNSVEFTKNFAVECTGGASSSFSYYGGFIYPSTNEDAITELPYSITVYNGTFRRFEGGSIRNVNTTTSGSSTVLGSVAAHLTVNIHGGTFGNEGEYDALAPNKTFNAFNFSGMNILADGGTLNIIDGTFYAPIYLAGQYGHVSAAASQSSALTASDRKYYANDGDITVNISGGTFLGGAVAASYVQAGYTQLLRGNYTVSVTGGTFAEGTVFDATQVKAYDGEDKKATITIAKGIENITPKRFDTVNGVETNEKDPLRVAFIGDSITEGHSSSNWMSNSYPAKYLENALANTEDVIIANFGVSNGGMRPMAVRYYPAMLAYPLSLYECGADIFVFALGINDAGYTGSSSGSLAEYYNRYKALIEAHGNTTETDHVYVTSVLPLTSSTPQNRLRAFSLVRPTQKQIVTDLNAEYPGKYTFIDLYSLLWDEFVAAPGKDQFFHDGIHPTDTGYTTYGKVLYDAIKNKEYQDDSFFMTDIYVSDNGKKLATGTYDDPISSLEYAIAKCADTATIHIKDTITFSGHLHTPRGMQKLTIVGETAGATLHLTLDGGVSFVIGSDLKLDNVVLSHVKNDITISGNYNNVEITETVSTPPYVADTDTNTETVSNIVRFYAGRVAWTERSLVDLTTVEHFASEEDVSSDKDVTVTLNGGDYTVFVGGNRFANYSAPIGTYSGNMTINIGAGATINEPTATALCGVNYLTGTITANINGWGEAPIREHSAEVGKHKNFDFGKNTGTITMNIAESVAKTPLLIGDFNEDGTFSMADVLSALKEMLSGKKPDASSHYYGASNFSTRHILSMLKQLAK